MHTFLNRLLALRIADQNSLFASFDMLLQSIVERAAASGQLDHGVEDVVADGFELLGEEVIRTDAVTGAQTKLIRFALQTRRDITHSQEALDWVAHLEAEAIELVVNSKSGGAGLVVKGVTTTDDNDRLIQAVRLVRPEKRTTVQLETYQQSAWEVAEPAVWRATWDAEVAGIDPFIRREMCLATGLLLPIWSHLPQTSAQVRRVKAPDGRRWLGRVLDSVEASQLKVALGLTDTAAMVAAEGVASELILKDGASVGLPSGLWLRRARVMDAWRIEVVGGAEQRAAFKSVGCSVEIINYQPRVFVPTRGPALARVLERWPAQSILPRAA